MSAVWKSTSATQVGAFDRCERYWYYGWIMKIRGPQTDAQKRGSDIHAEIEHYLEKGWIRESEYSGYPEAAKDHLPDPKTAQDLHVEHRINLRAAGVPWIGFIDVLYGDRKPRPLVLDTKTSSDFRYAKTPEQLAVDTQLNSYARYVYEKVEYKGELDIAHLYLKTYPASKKIPQRGPQTKLVIATVTEESVNKIWERDTAVVERMKQAALIDDVEKLPGNANACGMYGGCPHRLSGLCSFTPTLSEFFKSTSTDNPKEGNVIAMSTFLSQVKKANASSTTAPALVPPASTTATPPVETAPAPAPAAPAPVPAVAQPADVAVLPPDAPERTTPIPSAVGEPAGSPPPPPATGRGRPRKTPEEKAAAKAAKAAEKAMAKAAELAEAAKAAQEAAGVPVTVEAPVQVAEAPAPAPAPVQAQAPAPAPVQAAPTGPAQVQTTPISLPPVQPAVNGHGFTLYIDCMPVKNQALSGIDVTSYDDWIAPAIMSLDEEVKSLKNKDTYLLLPYSEEKAAYQLSVRLQAQKGLPPAMLISSGTHNGALALGVLMPLATHVVKGIR